MAADSQTYIITQLLIAACAGLCISLALNWFLKRKLKNYMRQHRQSAQFDYADSGKGTQVSADGLALDASVEMQNVASLSDKQMELSAQLKEIAEAGEGNKLASDERQHLLRHVEQLEASLLASRQQFASLNIQLKQVQSDLALAKNKGAALKKGKESQSAEKPRESTLVEETQQANEKIAQQDKELKKLKLNRSLMQKEIEDIKAVSGGVVELTESLKESEASLKRSEAERSLLESSYVELEQKTQDSQELREELERLKKEYDMLEQRFIGSSDYSD